MEGRRQNRRVEVTLERNGEMPDLSLQPPAFESTRDGMVEDVADQVEASTPQGMSGVSIFHELAVSDVDQPRIGNAGGHASVQELPKAPSADKSYLQVVALSDAERAGMLANRISDTLAQPARLVNGGGLYRVQLGPVGSSAELEALQNELSRLGYSDSYAVKG